MENYEVKHEQKFYLYKLKAEKLIYWVFFYSLIIGLCFAILYPIFKLIPMVFNNLEDLGNPDIIWVPRQFSILSFKAAVRLVYKNGMPMVYSLGYALIIALIQVFMSAMAGYSLGRVDFRGRKIIFFLVILTFVVPSQSLLISQYLRFKNFDIFGLITLINGGTIDLINRQGILYILALLGFGVKQSLFIFIYKQFFEGLPNELEEAAFIDGCGFYKTYFRIALPNSIPATITVAILSFVWNYADTYYTGYFHPDGQYLSVILTNVFRPANMQTILRSLDVWYDVAAANALSFDAVKQAAGIIYMIPLLIIYFIIQKRMIENFERSGIVG